MKLHAIGINYAHDENFSIKRAAGSGDNLLLIFKSSAIIEVEGEFQHVAKDTVVLYSKGSPQIYGADGKEFINHWVHFDCNENDIFFERVGAVFDRPVLINSVLAAENILGLLQSESLSVEENKDECVDLLLRLLIAKTVGRDSTVTKGAHSEKLRQLRAGIYGNPAGRFTVDEMAKSLMVSPSHFAALYKGEFGISCYDDVLKAKNELAQYYLKNTRLTVKEIAELCGFENDVHFMRQFKKRTGVTALVYRRNSNDI